MRVIAGSRNIGYSPCVSVRRSTVSSRYRYLVHNINRTTQRRQNSTTAHSEKEKESRAESAGNGHASAAGAPTHPVTIPASRSLRQMVESSPIGKLGRLYGRAQEKRPYVTQLCSSLVVYLCGDLSAQLLFPSDEGKEASSGQKSLESDPGQHGEEAQQAEEKRGGYDPLRTLRHLTVGLVSSIPSYKW